MPIWFIELIAPFIATKDNIGTGDYYRLYDAKTPQKGSKKASGPKKPAAKKVTIDDSPFAELKNLKFGKSRP